MCECEVSVNVKVNACPFIEICRVAWDWQAWRMRGRKFLSSPVPQRGVMCGEEGAWRQGMKV